MAAEAFKARGGMVVDKVVPTEDTVQQQVARVLDALCGSPHCPKMFWCHVPNGEARHPRVAEKLKRMGVKSGVWDILLWGPNNKNYYIEMKRPTKTGATRKPLENKLSDNQQHFRKTLVALGVPKDHFAVADSVDGVLEALKAWELMP